MRISWFLNTTGVAVIGLLLFAVSVKSREAGEPESNEPGRSVTSITPPPITPNEGNPVTPGEQSESEIDARVVLLTIRPTGIEPKELELPAGKYLVVVRNRSGADEFAFRLERETGEVLHQARSQRLKRDMKRFVELIPGVYFLKETNHPDWTCRITIASR